MSQLYTQCPIKVAVIGAGYWGKNLVRNFHQLGALAAVCDALPRPDLQAEFSKAAWYTDWRDVLHHPRLDGVVIATPSHTHFDIASQSLMLGKHVYVEKPLTTNSADAEALLALSQKEERVLMVGHLLMYHPAVNRLKQLIEMGELGDIKAIQSNRLSFNPNRPDTSVLWDLAPHDLSLACYLLNAEPQSIVSAVGHRVGDDGRVDDVKATLHFPGDVAVDIHTSWVSPVKHVQLVVHGSKATAVLDDVQTTNKLQVFTKQPAESKTLPVASTPDWLALEPLKLECQHFINCLTHQSRPLSDAHNGLAIVRLIEQIDHLLMR